MPRVNSNDSLADEWVCVRSNRFTLRAPAGPRTPERIIAGLGGFCVFSSHPRWEPRFFTPRRVQRRIPPWSC